MIVPRANFALLALQSNLIAVVPLDSVERYDTVEQMEPYPGLPSMEALFGHAGCSLGSSAFHYWGIFRALSQRMKLSALISNDPHETGIDKPQSWSLILIMRQFAMGTVYSSVEGHPRQDIKDRTSLVRSYTTSR